MYGLTGTIDLSFLVGETVMQVCLGRYQTQVRMDDATIAIECKHTLVTADGETVWNRSAFPSEGLSRLLGQTVSKVSVLDERTLELTFSAGDRLSLVDDSDQYESFQIATDDKYIVV